MRVLFAAVLVSSFGTASCGEKNYEDEFEKWAAQRRRKVKHVDLLRPEEEKLRLIYFGMLEEMREKEISPEVSVERKMVPGTVFHDGKLPAETLGTRSTPDSP
jgi:Uri superfamily endonuclease